MPSRVLLYTSLIIKSFVFMLYLHLEGIYARNQEMSDANGEAIIHVDRIDSIDLGGEEDLHDVSIDPLPRASRCLYRALHLSVGISNADAENPSADGLIPSPREGSADVDMDCYEMALVSLAYVKLHEGSADVDMDCYEMALASLVHGGGSISVDMVEGVFNLKVGEAEDGCGGGGDGAAGRWFLK